MLGRIACLEKTIPKVQPGRFRIEMAASRRDCDPIPKCEGAGEIIESEGKRLQIMHNGLSVMADGYYGPEVTEIVSLQRGHHEPQEELAFYHVMKALPPKALMLELGAYWSYYSLCLRNLIRTSEERSRWSLFPNIWR